MRPPWAITAEELALFMRRNRTFRMAWEEMASVMRMRDYRGVKKWVFALGWLSCAYYYRRFMLEAGAALKERVDQHTATQIRQWETRSGIGIFIMPDTTPEEPQGAETVHGKPEY